MYFQSKLRRLAGIVTVWILLCGSITSVMGAEVKPENEVKIEAGSIESGPQQNKGDMVKVDEKPVVFVPKKIGVIEFENQIVRDGALGGAAADAITASLLKINSTDVIERAYLNEAFTQNGVTRVKGVIDPVMVSTVGASLGLDYVIMGNVVGASTRTTPAHWVQVKMGKMSVPQYVAGHSSSNAKIDIMLIDVKTAKVVFTEKINGSSANASVLDALLDAGRVGVKHVYKFMPLQGVVTKLEGDKVFLNLGKENKIDVKNKFMVEGSVNGKEPLWLEVVKVNDTDCAAVVKGNGGIVKVGDVATKSI